MQHILRNRRRNKDNLYSVEFSGADNGTNQLDSINCGLATIFSANVGSFSFWFRLRSGTQHGLWGKRNYGEHSISIYDRTATSFQFFSGGSGTNAKLESTTTLELLTWYHAVFVVDTGTMVSIYLNGSLDAGPEENTSFDLLDSPTLQGSIGKAEITSKPLLGWMYETAIFDMALSADAISAMYNNGDPLDLRTQKNAYGKTEIANMLHYYRMIEGRGTNEHGTPIKDYGTLNRTATFQGGVSSPTVWTGNWDRITPRD